MKPRIPNRPAAKQANQRLNELNRKFQAAYAAGQMQQAQTYALQAHCLNPNAIAPLSDAATCAVLLENWPQAIELAQRALRLNPDHINALDSLAHAYGALRDWPKCGEAGRRALRLRDQRYSPQVLPPLPDLPHTGDVAVLAFSLYGNQPAYIEPAVLNAQLQPEIYPGWQAWFYVDGSVPETARRRLREAGARVIEVDEEAAGFPGTMWRFLALDDPSVGYVVFRDADSVISPREASTVAQWIGSGRYFHTIRDAGSHTELVLAGLWGAAGGSIPDVRGKIRAYLSQGQADKRFADQYFLREHLWGYIKQSLFATDRLFGFMDGQPFPEEAGLFDYDSHHVGCNEARSVVTLTLANPPAEEVRWTLFSRVRPLLNPDYSIRADEQEREICSYTARVRNGTIQVALPQRYVQGMKHGWTRIAVQAA